MSKIAAPVVSRIGTDSVYVELSMRFVGAKVELIATRVEHLPVSCRYIKEEIGRELVDVEDAVNGACDLEWLAVDNLDQTGDRGYTDPRGFGEAVEHALDAAMLAAAE